MQAALCALLSFLELGKLVSCWQSPTKGLNGFENTQHRGRSMQTYWRVIDVFRLPFWGQVVQEAKNLFGAGWLLQFRRLIGVNRLPPLL